MVDMQEWLLYLWGCRDPDGGTMPEDSVMNNIQAKDIIALLGKGSEFEGKLTFEGIVQIDGRFTGEIFSKGTLIIGETARVKAEISVSNIVIMGDVAGNIRAHNCVELHAPGRLVGNIITPALFVQKGVIFEGNTIMESDAAHRAAQQTAGSPPPLPE